MCDYGGSHGSEYKMNKPGSLRWSGFKLRTFSKRVQIKGKILKKCTCKEWEMYHFLS